MRVNYPNPSLNQQKTKVLKSHGMLFENALNITNEYYRIHQMAHIYKKPTPVQVVKVDYPKRSKARIIEAYYRTPSTTDYNGVYKGRYLDYEAKETNNLNFAFKHIFPHQIKHLTDVAHHGGIAFLIIYYKRVNEIYIIDINQFNKLYLEGENGGQKSLSILKAKEIGILVKQGYTPPIDYLKAIDEYYFKGD